MSEYRSNVSLSEAAQLIRDAKSIAITTHAKPDGDAFGSAAAMVQGLRTLCPDVDVTGWLMPPVPASFGTMKASGSLFTVTQDLDTSALEAAELVIIVDTGAWAQLQPLRPLLEPKVGRTLIVDHHISGDVPAKYKYIDSNAAACCTVVADLLDELAGVGPVVSQDWQSRTQDGRRDDVHLESVEKQGGIDPNPVIRDESVVEALFAGVASDTGWFRFSNTSARTHELAARLISAGCDHADLYARLEQTERPEKLALMIRALSSLKLVADGQAAMMVVRESDFVETGAKPEETERFVDIPQAVTSVKVVVLISQPPSSSQREDGKDDTPPLLRVSFRSKPGHDAVNVSTLAQKFGGGGHARAAGVKFDIPVDQAVDQIEKAIIDALSQGS
jgi:bifunctional oligoribonuclease and PAP phosphatase NrnA